MSQHTSQVAGLQAASCSTPLSLPSVALLRASVLIALVCVLAIALGLLAVEMQSQLSSHAVSSMAVVPHPWGCGGSSTSC
jgi:hypothetical protein